MKRREALKQIGFGLSIGYVSPWFQGCKAPLLEPDVRYDGNIVIVGAGAAGLYLASILHAKGLKVTILEARSEIGGRISSYGSTNRNVFAHDVPVELGANIIYGSDSVLAVNLAEARIPVTQVNSAFTEQFVIEKQAKSASDWNANSNFIAAKNFVASLSDQSGNTTTVGQAVSGLPQPAQALLNSWVGNLYGSSNASIGLSGLAENLKMRQDNNMLVLKGNLMQPFFLSRFHAEKYPIILNAPVTSINYGNADSLVNIAYGENKKITANKVVVTVPVSILKSNAIAFTPILPSERLSSMQKIGMDSSIRVVLEFKKNFWGEKTSFIWGTASAPHCFANGIVSTDKPSTMLSITINGPKAVEFSTLGQNMINKILVELDSIYDGQATKFIRKDAGTDQIISVIKDWGREKYIKGGYSYPMVSTAMDDYANLGKSIDNKLFFAGEATDTTGYAGTVNGALNSAERASKEIIQSILNN